MKRFTRGNATAQEDREKGRESLQCLRLRREKQVGDISENYTIVKFVLAQLKKGLLTSGF